MSPFTLGIIAIIIFCILLFLKTPIGIALGIVGFSFLIVLRGIGPAFQIIGTVPWSWASSENLFPMTLFVLMAYFIFYCDISKDLYETAYKWMGRFPGGLAMATTVACAIFGAVADSMAACATFGSVAYPEMKKRNYDSALATGSICAGGSLASLIPPSICFIMIGFLTQTSITDLFIGGIIPGLLLMCMFLLVIFLQSIRNPQIAPRGSAFSTKEMLISLKGVIATVILFILVIGGLYLGAFTPSEGGGIGAFGALLIGLVGRRITLRKFIDAGRDTVVMASFIVVLIMGASIFNTFLGVSGVTTQFSAWLNNLSFPPMLILAVILLIYIPLGMFLDIGAIIVLTVPIIFPPLVSLGFNPVYLGLLVTMMGELGFITPPVGMNAFILAGITKVPLETIFRGILPFIITMFICIVLMAAFPEIILFLPNLMK